MIVIFISFLEFAKVLMPIVALTPTEPWAHVQYGSITESAFSSVLVSLGCSVEPPLPGVTFKYTYLTALSYSPSKDSHIKLCILMREGYN